MSFSGEAPMNRPHIIFESRSWLLTLLLAAFVACWGERAANTVTTVSPAIAENWVSGLAMEYRQLCNEDKI